MPFALIPPALGLCFCLVWTFIGGMILRDGRRAVEQERATETGILPLNPQRATQRLPNAIGRACPAAQGRPIRAAS